VLRECGVGPVEGGLIAMGPADGSLEIIRDHDLGHPTKRRKGLSGILRGVKLLYYQLLMSTDRRPNILRSESSGAPDF